MIFAATFEASNPDGFLAVSTHSPFSTLFPNDPQPFSRCHDKKTLRSWWREERGAPIFVHYRV